jgi:16S rRNA (guanine527-N7)-methyltransferase
MTRKAYGPAQFARDFGVSRETLERLELYETLLRQWQKAVNLAAPSSLGHVWRRHFADSAQLLALAPPFRRWVDIGSGGGFPGLVIAILAANHEDREIGLVESNSRKCAFLAEVARRTGTKAIVHNDRIESAAAKIGAVDVVSARALAPLAGLLGLAHPYFAQNTVGLFLKGREWSNEIEAARENWSFQWKTTPSMTDSGGQIVEIRHLKPEQG